MIDLSLGQVGGASVVLASALALYAAITGALGAWRRDARLQTSARYGAVAVFSGDDDGVYGARGRPPNKRF